MDEEKDFSDEINSAFPEENLSDENADTLFSDEDIEEELFSDEDIGFSGFEENEYSTDTEDADVLEEYDLESKASEFSFLNISVSGKSFNTDYSAKEIIDMELDDDDYNDNMKMFCDSLAEEFNLSFKKPEEEIVKTRNIVIDNVRLICEEVKNETAGLSTQLSLNGQNEVENQKTEFIKRRTYDKDTPKLEIKFTPQKEENEGFSFKKLIILLAIALAVGVFEGIKANSYYQYAIANKIRIESEMSCLWIWLSVSDLPYNFSTINFNVFKMGVIAGAGLFGIIAVFVYLDNEQKKNSRVGYEHGNRHLCTPAEFKKYQNYFMD